MTDIYDEKRKTPASKTERIQKYGQMRFKDYTEEWRAGQRQLDVASVRHLNSLLEHHLYPAFASRRMNTFDHRVADRFAQDMERNNVCLATQTNAFDKLKSILLDANRLGMFSDNPLDGVIAPKYDPKRAVIPSVDQLRGIRVAGNDEFLLAAGLMNGCELRNGEALAVNFPASTRS